MANITIGIKVNAPLESIYEYLTQFEQVSVHLPIMRKRMDVVDTRCGPYPSMCIENRTVVWDNVSRYYIFGFCADGIPAKVESIRYDLKRINDQTTLITQTIDYENRPGTYPISIIPLTWFVLRGVMKNNLRAHKTMLEDQLAIGALPVLEAEG